MTERDIIVLSDVDGTQVIPGEDLPRPQVQAVAKRLRTNGVPLLEVTGRRQYMIKKLVEPLGLKGNLCTIDGGATVARADSDDVLWSQWLSAETTRSVIGTIGHLCTEIIFDDVKRTQNTQEMVEAVADDTITVGSSPSVFAVFDAGRRHEVVNSLGDLTGIDHTPVMDFDDMPSLRCIQVVSEGVDKQRGIMRMLELGGLTDQRRLVIGDGMNDFPLFDAARPDDIRVAMGNAPDALKDIADWVAPPVTQHGFAVAMAHYKLI